MKTFFSLSLLLLLLVGPVFAQKDISLPMMGPDCQFTDEQVEKTQTIGMLFKEYGTTKLVQKYFSSSYQELPQFIVDRFIRSVHTSLSMCGYEGLGLGDDSQMRYYPSFFSYDEFREYIGETVETFLTIKKYTPSSSDQYLIAIDQLRPHLIGDFGVLNFETFVNKTFETTMTVGYKNPTDKVNLLVDIDGSSVGNIGGSSLEGQNTFAVDLGVSNQDILIDMNLSMQTDIKIVDGSMYIKIDDFVSELREIQFEYDRDENQFEDLLTQVKLIEGKYISIPMVPQGVDSGMGVMLPFSSSNPLQTLTMLQQVANEDRFMTYSQDGDVMYGGINPHACGGLTAIDQYIVDDCIESFFDLIEESNGMGVFLLEKTGDGYSFGITDRYTDEKLPEEMKSANKPMIRRNDQEIKKVFMDFGETGTIVMENNQRKVDMVMDDGYSMDPLTKINMEGVMNDQKIDMIASIRNADGEFLLSMDMNGDENNLSGLFSISFESTSEYNPFVFSFEMDFSQQMDEIDVVEVKAPRDDEILDLESLMRM